MLPTTSRPAAPLSMQAATAAASYHKTATGPVGLEVNPNSRDDFIKQQKALLEKVKVRGEGMREGSDGGRVRGRDDGGMRANRMRGLLGWVGS